MASTIIKKVTTKMKEVHGLIYTFSEWEVEGTLNCSGQESEERLSKLQKISSGVFGIVYKNNM
jgi:hypothetical protein